MGLLGSSGMVTRGDIWFEGKSLPDVPPKEMRRICGEKIGMIFQDFNLFDHLTAEENVSIALRKVMGCNKAEARNRALTELSRVGLAKRAALYPAQLSGGQKQRVAIARVLANEPEVILCDEATSALDSESEHMVQKALDNLMLNRTSLIIAHRLSTILEADRIVVMECGRIVDIGRHEELLGRCELYTRLYNMQFRAHENICGCETDLVES